MDDSEQPIDMVETPSNLLPDLSMLGIHETDRGICEDTFENRKILRNNKYSWIPVFDSTGSPTHNIQAISPEMAEARSQVALRDKKMLLEDPRDPNSNFVTGIDLIISPQVNDMVPAWVMSATRMWVKVERERQTTGKKVRPSLVSPPSRCRAIRSSGSRCQYWTGGRVGDDGYCRVHLGSLLQREANILEHSRNRLKSATGAAVDTLEQLMGEAESEPVRLGAAKEILDRAGIRGGVEIDSNIKVDARPAGELIAERLDNLRRSAEEAQQLIERRAIEQAEAEAENTVDAEVVDE